MDRLLEIWTELSTSPAARERFGRDPQGFAATAGVSSSALDALFGGTPDAAAARGATRAALHDPGKRGQRGPADRE